MASTPTSVSALRLAHADDEPVVFYGPPARLRGTLRLHNGSSEKVKLNAATLDLPNLRGPARQPLGQLPLVGRVYPNQQARVPVVLNLDPGTPPGTYEGTVGVGTQRQRVRVHVTEEVGLQVQPTSVSLFTEGDLIFPREFVVENTGNVPLRLGSECIVPLVDTSELLVGIRRGLRGACEAEEVEDVLKSILCEWSRQQVGTLSVQREDITLKPGETRPLTIAFTLPQDLQRFRRYVADLPLYTASLHVEVVTGDFKGGETPGYERPGKEGKDKTEKRSQP
jgi:hypothetical protein